MPHTQFDSELMQLPNPNPLDSKTVSTFGERCPGIYNPPDFAMNKSRRVRGKRMRRRIPVDVLVLLFRHTAIMLKYDYVMQLNEATGIKL